MGKRIAVATGSFFIEMSIELWSICLKVWDKIRDFCQYLLVGIIVPTLCVGISVALCLAVGPEEPDGPIDMTAAMILALCAICHTIYFTCEYVKFCKAKKAKKNS